MSDRSWVSTAEALLYFARFSRGIIPVMPDLSEIPGTRLRLTVELPSFIFSNTVHILIDKTYAHGWRDIRAQCTQFPASRGVCLRRAAPEPRRLV